MDEPLRKVKEYVSKRIEGDVPLSYVTTDIVPLYVLLCILEKLENIESDLAAMSSDSWNDHHNK